LEEVPVDATAARRPAGLLRRLGVEEVGWSPLDRHPGLVWPAAGGLLVAAVLAVTGPPPPVDLHSPLHRWYGIMDPACGMTRGVIAVLRGRLGQAWAYNPASLLVVPGAIAVLVRAAAGRLTGRWLDVRFHPTRLFWLLTTAVLLALWVNQQRHAALLLG
jgi:Protein of unknown function (DUF2752)